MKYLFAISAAALAIGAAPALAQNSAPLSDFNVPLANGGQRNLDAPGANGSDANVPNATASPGSTAGTSSRGTSAMSGGASTSSTSGARSGSAMSSADLGSAPTSYPVCRTRSQDRCRVPSRSGR